MQLIGGKPYLSVVEWAEKRGVHPGTVRNWRTNHVEPVRSWKFGAGVYFLEADVNKYLEGRNDLAV